MRSLPAMTDMKRDLGDKLSEASKDGMMMSGLSDLPDYDCGLCGSFNKESLDKLDMDSDVNVGDYLDIRSLAKVTSIHMKPGSNEIDRVDFCMTHIAVENEDEEGENTSDEAV